MDGSFSGLAAVALEDFAVTGSMGPIFDRSREHLVPSDVAVIRARRLLLQAATAVAEGSDPPGLAAETAAIRAGEGLVAPDASWRTLVPGNRRIAARPGAAVMAAADDA